MQKITVMGCADEKKVLKAVRKCGKKAELWPYPYEPEYHGFIQQYYTNNNNYNYKGKKSQSMNYHNSSSYNYHNHGYSNGDQYGYYQKPIGSTLVSEKAISLFNDDNPHACVIM